MRQNYQATTAVPYLRYEEWKGWNQRFLYSADDAAYFKREFRGIELNGSKVLEIGFGEGRFLSWAADQGAATFGTELLAAMRDAAEVFGINVIPQDLADSLLKHKQSFDLIVLLDVAEHWTLDEIVINFYSIEQLLKPGGLGVVRFPNSQSPFGLAPQNGDPTHRSALSQGIFNMLFQNTRLRVIRYGDQAFFIGHRPVRGVIRLIRYLVRVSLSSVLGFVYATSIPWGPVVTLVLEKDSAEQGQPSITHAGPH